MMVKVCGMRDADNIRLIESLGVDMMGFIFYKGSPRYAGENPPAYMPGCRRVGVFVDADMSTVLSTMERWGLDTVQLHGSESPDFCRALRRRGYAVIKAFATGNSLADGIAAYDGACDLFLFDTKCARHGGSGRMFDWRVLGDYRGDTPFLLSGGIGPDSVAGIADFRHPRFAGIDLNSAFESAPAVKSYPLLKTFLENLR